MNSIVHSIIFGSILIAAEEKPALRGLSNQPTAEDGFEIISHNVTEMTNKNSEAEHDRAADEAIPNIRQLAAGTQRFTISTAQWRSNQHWFQFSLKTICEQRFPNQAYEFSRYACGHGTNSLKDPLGLNADAILNKYDRPHVPGPGGPFHLGQSTVSASHTILRGDYDWSSRSANTGCWSNNCDCYARVTIECKQKLCKCDNGIPATGTACPYTGKAHCTSCNEGYTLVGPERNPECHSNIDIYEALVEKWKNADPQAKKDIADEITKLVEGNDELTTQWYGALVEEWKNADPQAKKDIADEITKLVEGNDELTTQWCKEKIAALKPVVQRLMDTIDRAADTESADTCNDQTAALKAQVEELQAELDVPDVRAYVQL
jgi:phenylpyruvate tautomerase PptA (4-oxalocrotonate tautomerase family)